jgi:hypothetical protein
VTESGPPPTRCEDGQVSADPTRTPVVIRISPIAHFAVGFLALGLLALVFAGPPWFVLLLVIPVLLSLVVVRYRTVADSATVTARSLVGSRTVGWNDIDGLRFDKSSWATAQLKSGAELRLPAVTFNTLPLLTAASGGRVPNPYD